LAAIVAHLGDLLLPLIGLLELADLVDHAATAFSMPRLSAIGLAPARDV
jgi:hypothetical protein